MQAVSIDEKLALLSELAAVLDKLPAPPNWACGGAAPKRSSALLERIAMFKGAHAHPEKREEAVCPSDFKMGLQQLPRTATLYRYPWAELLLFCDALTFGLMEPFFSWLKFERVREVRLLLGQREAGKGPMLFRSLLPPRPCTQSAFEGSAWLLGQTHRRFLGVLLILLLINVGAWVISLTTVALGTASTNPLNVIWAWQMQALADVSQSVLDGVPSLLALAGWSVLAATIIAVFFAVHVMGKSDITQLRGVEDVGSVLSVALRPRAPLAMVSYPWLASQLAVARSLASCLPGCWIDVQMLVPGCHIADTTRGTSRWAFCLILIITVDYFSRPACVLEFVTACLNRCSAYQHSVVYCAPVGAEEDADAPPLKEDALDLLRRLGFAVFSTPKDLLNYMHSNVYTASSPEDKSRVVEWFGRVGDVRSDVPRGLRLPFPSLFEPANAVPLSSVQRLLPPPLAVCAGRHFISADGQSLGTYAAFSLEQLALALSLLFLSLAAGLMTGAYWQYIAVKGSALAPGTTFGLPIVCLAILGVIMGSALPLNVDLDARNYHSDVLLNLSVAAWCNAQHVSLAGAKRSSWLESSRRTFLASSKRFWGLGGGGGGGGASEPSPLTSVVNAPSTPSGGSSDIGSPSAAILRFSITVFVPPNTEARRIRPGCSLNAALTNMCTFLFRLGLNAEQVHLGESPGPADSCQREEEAKKASTIFVFVLLTLADAAAWRARWKGKISDDRAILVISMALMNASDSEDLRSYMLIVVQPTPGGVEPNPAQSGNDPNKVEEDYVLSKHSAYSTEGLAVNLLDAIGAKVGPAFLERERESRRREPPKKSFQPSAYSTL
jgi:hypothetical protein